MECVRDRFWIWGHDAGSHDRDWNLPGPSRITPVEGVFYLGVPNIIMVRYDAGSLPPTVQYSVPFRALNRVVWSVVGAGGLTTAEERSHVLQLAGHLPNMTGVMMDDFFKSESKDENIGTLSLDELRSIRSNLTVSGRKLDLWVVLYKHQLGLPVREHLALCDKVTFWTWKPSNLESLEHNLARAEELAPASGKLLGCYMWDYDQKCPMLLDLMKMQCEIGLQWLRQGRIEGMIFLASCICDLELEAVEWTRSWIAKVGSEKL